MTYAIRGAISPVRNFPEEIEGAVASLLREISSENRLAPEEVVAAWLTTTPDLTEAFAAAGFRQAGAGWAGVPRVDSVCPSVNPDENGIPGTIRVLLLVGGPPNVDPPRHVYLGDAASLPGPVSRRRVEDVLVRGEVRSVSSRPYTLRELWEERGFAGVRIYFGLALLGELGK